jgi:hypothetical protein
LLEKNHHPKEHPLHTRQIKKEQKKTTTQKNIHYTPDKSRRNRKKPPPKRTSTTHRINQEGTEKNHHPKEHPLHTR